MEESPKVRKAPVSLARGSHTIRRKLHGKSFVVPSLITMVAIFCGFLAIASAIRGEFVYAARCVLIAIILDGLDGRVARRLNATSAFGREFDSLSDVISFGVAPAILTYIWAFSKEADEFGLLVSFLFLVCSATRLARFNVVAIEKDTTGGFTGLPTPGAAAPVVCLVWLFPTPLTGTLPIFLAMVFVTAIALLMVSTLPYLSIKRLKFSSKHAPLSVVVLAVLVALVWKYPALTMFSLSSLYAFSGVFVWVWRKITRSDSGSASGPTAAPTRESSVA
jgi:CDP-diacylglycerol--serine O-phosphatidyltransferase